MIMLHKSFVYLPYTWKKIVASQASIKIYVFDQKLVIVGGVYSLIE